MAEGDSKLIGFKFLIPSTFPTEPPIPFLDEEINDAVIEMLDYVLDENELDFLYLEEWRNKYA